MANERNSASLVDVDADGIPFGWEQVRLTAAELDALVEAAEAGDEDTANAVVAGAYARLFPYPGIV